MDITTTTTTTSNNKPSMIISAPKRKNLVAQVIRPPPITTLATPGSRRNVTPGYAHHQHHATAGLDAARRKLYLDTMAKLYGPQPSESPLPLYEAPQPLPLYLQQAVRYDAQIKKLPKQRILVCFSANDYKKFRSHMNMNMNPSSGNLDWPNVESLLLCPCCGRNATATRSSSISNNSVAGATRHYGFLWYPLPLLQMHTGFESYPGTLGPKKRTICGLTCLDCMEDLLDERSTHRQAHTANNSIANSALGGERGLEIYKSLFEDRIGKPCGDPACGKIHGTTGDDGNVIALLFRCHECASEYYCSRACREAHVPQHAGDCLTKQRDREERGNNNPRFKQVELATSQKTFPYTTRKNPDDDRPACRRKKNPYSETEECIPCQKAINGSVECQRGDGDTEKALCKNVISPPDSDEYLYYHHHPDDRPKHRPWRATSKYIVSAIVIGCFLWFFRAGELRGGWIGGMDKLASARQTTRTQYLRI